MERLRKSRKRGRKYCEHCDSWLAKSTYYLHRSQFYDEELNVWRKDIKASSLYACTSSDSEVEVEESGSGEHFNSDDRADLSLGDLSDLCDDIDESPLESQEIQQLDSTGSSSNDEDQYNMDAIEDQMISSSEDNESDDNSSSEVSTYFMSLIAILVLWQFSFKISNAALAALLKILKQFFVYIGRVFEFEFLHKLGNCIPLTLSTVYHKLSLKKNDFETFVVCPSCHSIYDYSQCFEVKFGRKVSKKCSHVFFPNHSHVSRRIPCGTTLLKTIRRKERFDLEPFKVYCYKSLRQSIEQLIKRKGFTEKCENWRSREVPDGFLCDIYDGANWKHFNSQDKNYFLSNPHCYLLTLNVDWFEPFERGVYSVGAIYLTVQNLPRADRNRIENIIIAGVIPGPKEPSKTINSYLTPLVLELKEAWSNGFNITVDGVDLCIKLAISCVTCDIPATRKVAGFLSHNAVLGCNKCLKEFRVSFGEATDYSGYNRQEWTPRTLQQHLDGLEAIRREVTMTGCKSKEAEKGVRYSVLIDLPYFDPCKFVAIDSMHNLFLGTAKHAFATWVELGILSNKSLTVIEKRIKQFNIPIDVGRIPSNIQASYKSFTANQWKNWIVIYSIVVLKDLIPAEHLRCWQLFVRSCVILCSYCIRLSDITAADVLLEQFCCQFIMLYGDKKATFNMHLHLHLKETYVDFGPPHSTWCYAFERYNGLLGSYFTNKKNVEPQIMRRFCQHQMILRTDLLKDFDIGVIPFYERTNNNNLVGDSFYLLHYAVDPLSIITSFSITNHDQKVISPVSSLYEEIMSAEDLSDLEMIYKQLYPFQHYEHLSATYHKFGRLQLAGDVIGSDMPGPHSHTSSVIMAYWPSRGSILTNIDYSKRQVGIVQYYIRHKIRFVVNNETVEHVHLFAYVKWKESHEHHSWYGASATVCSTMFEIPAACCYLPVQRIFCRCAFIIMPVTFLDLPENVFIACPVSPKYCL